MTMPKVSVIIPTYNAARWIGETIDSVQSQTYKNYEIIVIDDGSVDSTREVLEKYIKNINYIYQDNKGVSSARNHGIKISAGEYIAFLDNDDIWLPDKLSLQIQVLESQKNIAMIFTDGELFDEYRVTKRRIISNNTTKEKSYQKEQK